MTPDRWLVLTVRAGPADAETMVPDALLGLGARAVEEREGAWITHLPPPDDAPTFVERVRRSLRDLPGVESVAVDWSWQPHEEWAETWKRGLRPRRVTERIVVAPSWSDPELGADDRLIRVDPGIAFGTAEHATTRGCLRLLDGAVAPGDRILDVGAGSGILSIAAALLGAREVMAMEADRYACETARENAELNGVDDRVHVVERRVDAGDLADRGPADGIVANIETGVLLELLPGLSGALEPGGWLILSGIPVPEQDRIAGAARAEGLTEDGEWAEEGWWSVRYRPGGG